MVRVTGGVCDTTPSVGDTLNTSSTSEYVKKRSGPAKGAEGTKIKNSYTESSSGDECTGDLMPNKVETGSAKVHICTFIISLGSYCVPG